MSDCATISILTLANGVYLHSSDEVVAAPKACAILPRVSLLRLHLFSPLVTDIMALVHQPITRTREYFNATLSNLGQD